MAALMHCVREEAVDRHSVGYIVGGYRYGAATTDRGKFILALRRPPRLEWNIVPTWMPPTASRIGMLPG